MTHTAPCLECERIEILSAGDADVLVPVSGQIRPPGPKDAIIRQTAVGVNFHDIYVRSGAYRTMSYPGTPGIEAAGTVEWIGEEVTSVGVGDTVAYIAADYGGYASRRSIDAERLVLVPAGIDAATAAASLLKGVTADMMLSRVANVEPGSTIVVHGAAGGVGQILVQLARSRDIEVIGTVGTERKAARAREAGCGKVVVRTQESTSDVVRDATGGLGANAVFDGVGAATFRESINSLRSFGHFCLFGQASGPIDPIDPAILAARSLMISRPVVFHHVADRLALQNSAALVFAAIRDGSITMPPARTFPLRDAAAAHRHLESAVSTGSLLLVPSV